MWSGRVSQRLRCRHIGTKTERLSGGNKEPYKTTLLFFSYSQKLQLLLWTNMPMKGVRSVDELNIKMPWTTKLVSKIINYVLRKKLGCNIDIDLNEFRTTVIDDKLHVKVEFECKQEDLDNYLTTALVRKLKAP